MKNIWRAKIKMEIISRKTISSGNASAVVLPKSWLNKQVRVELIDKTKEIILSEVLDILKSKIDISEIIGIYLFHEYPTEIRLSLDALHLLKNQITKNIIEITKEQKDNWFRGEDILVNNKNQTKEIETSKNLGALGKEEEEKFGKEERGFRVIKYKDDLIGTGKLTEGRITNYLPKERRRKGK